MALDLQIFRMSVNPTQRGLNSLVLSALPKPGGRLCPLHYFVLPPQIF